MGRVAVLCERGRAPGAHGVARDVVGGKMDLEEASEPRPKRHRAVGLQPELATRGIERIPRLEVANKRSQGVVSALG